MIQKLSLLLKGGKKTRFMNLQNSEELPLSELQYNEAGTDVKEVYTAVNCKTF
jgi:hypothetical protein